jgi:hypothetical protein
MINILIIPRLSYYSIIIRIIKLVEEKIKNENFKKSIKNTILIFIIYNSNNNNNNNNR